MIKLAHDTDYTFKCGNCNKLIWNMNTLSYPIWKLYNHPAKLVFFLAFSNTLWLLVYCLYILRHDSRFPIHEWASNISDTSRPGEDMSGDGYRLTTKSNTALLITSVTPVIVTINDQDKYYLASKQVVYRASSNSGDVPINMGAKGFCFSTRLRMKDRPEPFPPKSTPFQWPR